MEFYHTTRILIKHNLQSYPNILSFYVHGHLNMKLVFARKLVSYAIKIINNNNNKMETCFVSAVTLKHIKAILN